VRDKQSKRLKMPGYDALNDLLAAVEARKMGTRRGGSLLRKTFLTRTRTPKVG